MNCRIPLETAWDLLRGAASADGIEDISVEDARGRVCADDVRAQTDLPPFDTALYDGYAVASTGTSSILRVIETVYAGSVPRHTITDGTAAAVMTGAPVPAGADCVVPLESAREEDGFVHIPGGLKPGRHVAYRGSLCRRGDTLAAAGSEITPRVMQLFLSAGLTRVSVYRLPGVTVYSLGDELVRPPGPAEYGKIFSSNDASLAARLGELGVPAVRGGIVPDESAEIEKAVRKGLADSRLVITVGGTGRGEKDLMAEVVTAVCGGLLFDGVDIRPGGGTAVGAVDGKLVIALPGSPGAAAAAFELFIRPVLAELTRLARLDVRCTSCVAGDSYVRRKTGRRVLWGTVFLENAEGRVFPDESPPAGNAGVFLGSCLLDIPEKTLHLRAGDAVRVFL